MTALFGYFAAMFEAVFYRSINLAEAFIFLFVGLTLIYIRRVRFKFDLLFVIAFFVWSFASLYIVRNEPYFATSSFNNNIFRLLIYIAGFITIPYYLLQKDRIRIFFKHFTIITYIVCLIGIVEFVLILVGIKVDWRIYQYFIDFYEPKLSYTRIFSIFNEPAHFAIFIGTATILILKHNMSLVKPRKLSILFSLVFANLVLTLSIIGVFILIYLIYILIQHNPKRKYKYNKFFLFIISFLFIVLIGSQVETVRNEVVERVPQVLGKEDYSANHRILGSFEYAFVGIERSPIAGIGLGQLMPFYQNTYFMLEYYYFKDERGGGINNILTSILLQTGIVGLVLFILFFHNLLKKDKQLYFFFVLICFGWGFFNSAFFWTYLYISKVLIAKKDERNKLEDIKIE